MGEIINFRGTVVVKEHLQQDLFLAEVTEVFIEFGVGAIVLPFEPMSKCVQPMATDPKLYGNIVALKEDRRIIGAGSVVYLDSGFKDGIQRGQVFDAIRITKFLRPTSDGTALTKPSMKFQAPYPSMNISPISGKTLAKGKNSMSSLWGNL